MNEKAETLKNKEADFILDHTIYCKALEHGDISMVGSNNGSQNLFSIIKGFMR